MAKHVSVLLVGLGLALGGMVGTAGAETTLVRTGQMWGTDKSDGKVNATLAGWVLLAPNNMGSFTTAASCEAAIVGFQAQARDGTKWVTAQQQAAQQQDELFWRQAVRRAKEQEARARGARCVERSERS